MPSAPCATYGVVSLEEQRLAPNERSFRESSMLHEYSDLIRGTDVGMRVFNAS